MNLDFKNKLINGDSLRELKKIPSETFDLIFADPPYNLQLRNELIRPDRSKVCLLYTSPSPRDPKTSRMPSSA